MDKIEFENVHVADLKDVKVVQDSSTTVQVVNTDLSISNLKLSVQVGPTIQIVDNPKPKFISKAVENKEIRDPEADFFMLAVLALKMTHIEEFDAEYIHDADARKLFEQVKALRIPFHKWYSWLDQRFKFLAEAHRNQREILEQERAVAF